MFRKTHGCYRIGIGHFITGDHRARRDDELRLASEHSTARGGVRETRHIHTNERCGKLTLDAADMKWRVISFFALQPGRLPAPLSYTIHTLNSAEAGQGIGLRPRRI